MLNVVDKDVLINNLRKDIAKYVDDMDFYRSLLINIGEIIGQAAYISDDGSKQEDVLVTKLPQLVYGIVSANQEYDDILKENTRMRVMLQNAVITEQNLTATINELSNKCREVEYATHIVESKETNKHLKEIAEVLKTLAASK